VRVRLVCPVCHDVSVRGRGLRSVEAIVRHVITHDAYIDSLRPGDALWEVVREEGADRDPRGLEKEE
jgi:hypothetical protein